MKTALATLKPRLRNASGRAVDGLSWIIATLITQST
jgi:hypothetical protein